MKLGLDECLYLGNLESKRDWGYAKDYVEAMWMMLQQEKADDYVVATNETHSIREFIEAAAPLFGYDLVWKGKGLKETGVDKNTGKVIVRIDPKYFRPAEVDILIGDYSKAKQTFGWEPTVRFSELVKIMSEADLAAEAKKAGVKVPKIAKVKVDTAEVEKAKVESPAPTAEPGQLGLQPLELL
jgi:GDPmannose 4,6-dehydratase